MKYEQTEQPQTTDTHYGSFDQQQSLSQSLNTHPKQGVHHPAPQGSGAAEKQQDKMLLENYGVVRTHDDGLVQYRLAGSADHQILFQSKPGATEFNQSQHHLDAIRQSMIADMNGKYHVTFSKENEVAVTTQKESKDHKRYVPGDTLYARAPRISELMGVEAALASSEPSQLIGDKGQKGLEFYFLKKESFGKDTNDNGFFAGDNKHKLAVFFEPDAQPDRPITAVDAAKENQDVKTSFESLAAHEIAHNGQWNMRLFDLDKDKEMASKIGWTVGTDENNPYWLLQGKSGELYRLTDSGSKAGWIQCTEKGEPLGEDGKIGTEKSVHHFSNAEIQSRALVRPATDYFTAPDEMLADSLMLYRIGDPGRKQLMQSNADLYNVTKQFDQGEIDLRFGKGADGSSKLIRLPDGKLAPNDEANSQIVRAYEDSLRGNN